MVVDLHIEKIARGYKSFTPENIIDYQKNHFILTINRYRGRKGFTIDFIHGVGRGVLRGELISILEKSYPGIQYSDAPFSIYGYQGAIRVTIR